MVRTSVFEFFAIRLSVTAAALCLCLGAALFVGPAQAHEFWIEPAKFRPGAGESVALRLFVGQHFKGEPVLYAPDQFKRYITAGPAGEQPVHGTLGDDPAGSLTADEPGLYVVGYHSEKFDLAFDSFAKFEEYLAMEGLDHHLALARKRFSIRNTILETYTRCAKSLIKVGGAPAPADRALGLPLELIAETSPYAGAKTLTVRLLYNGRPLEGALVIASNRADATNKQRIRTDKAGRATVDLYRSGVWLINAVHMIPAGLLAKADWESFWASLTFERP